MAALDEHSAEYSAERYRLTSEKHHIECEQRGEWHFETLETEAIMLDQLVDMEGLRLKVPGIFGTDRWLTSNGNLVLPIGVAIALLITKQHNRAQLLWPGYLTYLTLVKQSEQIVRGCGVSFRLAADLCAEQNMPHESECFRTIAAHLSTRDERKPINARMVLQGAEQIYVFWQLLEKFESALKLGDHIEKSRVSAAILEQIRSKHSDQRRRRLYLLIQYVLYLAFQDQYRFLPVVALKVLGILSRTVTDTFDRTHVLTYRWKLFEALTLRQHGVTDRALEVEGSLRPDLFNSMDEPDGESLHNNADLAHTADEASTAARPDSRMTEKKVTKLANSCLERLAREYDTRQWYSAQAHVCELRLFSHLSRLRISSRKVPGLVLVCAFAISQIHDFERLWALLSSLKQVIARSTSPDQAVFGSSLMTEVVADLLSRCCDRAVILLLDWYRSMVGLTMPASPQAPMAELTTRWVIASFQRVAYFQLSYSDNAKHLSEEMKAIQGLIETRFNRMEDDNQAALRQSWENEELSWRKLND